MTRDEAQKLLGGYATGSLTEEERVALLEAALDDQELFDQLAEEDAVKELIDTPGVRGRLVAGLTPKPQPRSIWAWLWRPWPMTGLVGTAAAIVLLWAALPRTTVPQAEVPVATVAPSTAQQPNTPMPVEVAQSEAAQNRRAVPATRDAAPTEAGSEAGRRVSGFGGGANGAGPAAPMPFAATPPPQPVAPAAMSAPSGQIRSEQDKDKRPAPEQNAQVADASLMKAEKGTLAPAAQPLPPLMITNGTPSNEPVAMAKAASPAPPPPSGQLGVGGVATDNLRAGFAKGGAAPSIASARASLLPGGAQFGFRYQVQQDSVQITPNSEGWLTVRDINSGAAAALFPTRQVPAGMSLTVRIPATAQKLTIEFSVSAPAAVRADQATVVQERRELDGIVTLPNSGPGSRVEVTIPAHP